jgi:predicted RNA binding protein YcfA (HicA-like mRNA interferase family)
MPKTPREIIKLLEKNGFEFISSNGSHRKYVNPMTQKTAIVPYHNKSLKTGTEQSILKKAGLIKRGKDDSSG